MQVRIGTVLSQVLTALRCKSTSTARCLASNHSVISVDQPAESIQEAVRSLYFLGLRGNQH